MIVHESLWSYVGGITSEQTLLRVYLGIRLAFRLEQALGGIYFRLFFMSVYDMVTVVIITEYSKFTPSRPSGGNTRSPLLTDKK